MIHVPKASKQALRKARLGRNTGWRPLQPRGDLVTKSSVPGLAEGARQRGARRGMRRVGGELGGWVCTLSASFPSNPSGEGAAMGPLVGAVEEVAEDWAPSSGSQPSSLCLPVPTYWAPWEAPVTPWLGPGH